MNGLSLYALALMLNYLSEMVLLGFAIALPNLLLACKLSAIMMHRITPICHKIHDRF